MSDDFDDLKFELPQDFFDVKPKPPAPELVYYEIWENAESVTLITTETRKQEPTLVDNMRLTAGFGAPDADSAREFFIVVKGFL